MIYFFKEANLSTYLSFKGRAMKNEIVKFINGDLQLDVTVSPDNETVWLSQKQMAELFNKDRRTITRHIQNIFKSEELDKIQYAHFLSILLLTIKYTKLNTITWT